MKHRSPLTCLATAISLLWAAPRALADDPIQEFYIDSMGGYSDVDSQANLAFGDLHDTSKVAPDGTLLWTHPFDLPGGHTNMRGLAVDSEDNVIRGGYQEGTNSGYLAVKYDEDGTLLWYTLADLGDFEESIRVAVDELDNIYVFGEAYEGFTKKWLTVKFDPGGQVLWHRFGTVAEPKALAVRDGQVVVVGAAGGGNFVTISYAYDGSTNWEATYQSGSSGVQDVGIGSEGQVVVCGVGMAAIPPGLAGTVIQYDSLGNEQWVALYNGPYAGIESFRRVAIDETGAVVAVGYGLSSVPSDAWSIVKFDPTGVVLWTQLYDHVSYYEEATSVTVGPSGSIYVGGRSYRLGDCGIGSVEGQVVKYAAGGDFQWNHHLVCGSDPFLIHVDPMGGIYAASFWEVLRVREDVGDPYCAPAVPNSTGLPGVMLATGSTTVGHNELTLTATQLPPDRFGIFAVSETQGFVSGPGGSQGNLCLGGSIGRFVGAQSSGGAGFFSMAVDLEHLPTSPPTAVLSGQSWNFQAWFRDENPGPTSNLTDAVSVTFQ